MKFPVKTIIFGFMAPGFFDRLFKREPSTSSLTFALDSPKADRVSLLLLSPKDGSVIKKVAMEPDGERLFSCAVSEVNDDMHYLFELDDKTRVLDPYGLALNTTNKWNDFPETLKNTLVLDRTFNWGRSKRPALKQEEVVIYEMHVRGFTKHPSSEVKNPGTYLGIVDKIPYLKKLGVTAIELLPVFEFCEVENPRTNPITGERLYNVWGYNTVNFFTPMKRYAAGEKNDAAIVELKELVRACHEEKMEVYLDVVYNHASPLSTLSEIDKEAYFILSDKGEHSNYTGCGNSIQANHPKTMRWILNSLRYFTSEFMIDGFRFDLASTMVRGKTGAPLKNPPLFQAIKTDPVLSPLKWFMEPWDPGGLYQVGSFPMKTALEWNDAFQRPIRSFIRGDKGSSKGATLALQGSPHIYQDRWSVHYVCTHDGFTLHDLVSYTRKHNEANGEENRDGMDYNISANGGFEGVVRDPSILHHRAKQMKNFMTALAVTPTVPMMHMGDEMGHTQNGNNNAYPQDDGTGDIDWERGKIYESLIEYTSKLFGLRSKWMSGQHKLTATVISARLVKIVIGKTYVVYFNVNNTNRPVVRKNISSVIVTTDRLREENDSLIMQPYSSFIGKKS
ncbi:MAG: hypothetical protein A3F09_04420 [Chlamydiae bacterium RIFCSPHIGHO2_12_FULL_49_11]|nr:MAG: hypothetical protein A3F09_04420 [Chlamydiae bacterium RIFCSPHIGHO2_12_FULL_49_11]